MLKHMFFHPLYSLVPKLRSRTKGEMYSYLILLIPLLQLMPKSGALPACKNTCNNITFSYPFGLTAGCSSPGFMLTCNNSFNPPKLFVGDSNIEVILVSPENVFMQGWLARDCHNTSNSANMSWITLPSTGPYTFSYTRNKFTVVGCNVLAVMSHMNDMSACFSVCRNKESIINGSCSGIGCCQTAIPKGLKKFITAVGTLPNSSVLSFNPCTYSFLIDSKAFEFDVSDFYTLQGRSRVPVVLDWAVGNLTCAEAEWAKSLLCGVNSKCLESTNGPGYRCTCSEGFEGNPYLLDGCKDINECESLTNNPCVEICTNTPGSYICSCSNGTSGDGQKDGSGCTPGSKQFPLIQVVLGTGLGFLFMVVASTTSYWVLKKRRLIQMKEKFFKQNGGLLLQKHISSPEGAADYIKIFTTEELEKATNAYHISRILGRGGYGTVYKGILPDKRVVAIKKSRLIDKSQIEQFINEVAILSQVIHRNVVKILGCCLESQVPLLVYEYIPNGNLSQHLHSTDNALSLSWAVRLRIAAETAEALAYLHSALIRPIIHRDVKSANILLDKNLTAKVADFGASRLVPLGKAEVMTLVQGTLGYLDPEYFHTGRLTEKSDVYSFGVVLAELLTGEKPISSKRSKEEISLAMYFIMSMKRNQLFELLHPRVVNEGDGVQLQKIAELAIRCLRLTGEERPTMKEVAEELGRAKRFQNHPWAQEDNQEESGMLLVTQSASTDHTGAATWDEDSLLASYASGR